MGAGLREVAKDWRGEGRGIKDHKGCECLEARRTSGRLTKKLDPTQEEEDQGEG